MALRKYLRKIKPEDKRQSGQDFTSLSRKDVGMVGRDVRHVLGVNRVFKEYATGACHLVWVLCIAHLPFAADHTNRSITMQPANAVIH